MFPKKITELLFLLLLLVSSQVMANTLQYELPDSQWQQISLPITADASNTPRKLFGDDLPVAGYGTDWALFSYDASANTYVNPGLDGELKRGVAYWAFQQTGGSVTLDIPASAITSACPADQGCFEIPIATRNQAVQWNMFGNPLATAIPVSNLKIVTTAGSCASGCTLDQANSANIVANTLWSFNGTNYDAYTTNSLLPVWRGFWLAALPGADGLHPKLLIPAADNGVTWENIGAGGGGWMTAITVVNDQANTVYAISDVGGIYKSTDHGQTWESKNQGLAIYYVENIAYDPQTTTTLYAATRGGVYKSLDGGDHWTIKRSGFPAEEAFSFSAPISHIVVDPENTNIIYAGVGVPREGYAAIEEYAWTSAGSKGTIFKSTDFGESWTAIHSTGIPDTAMIYSLAIDPSNTSIVYAATSTGVYQSSDSGASWTAKNTGLPASKQAMSLVIDPVQPTTLYVTLWTEPGSASWQGGVYKSTNAGATWVAKNNGLPQVMGMESGTTNNYPAMIIDQQHPQTLYVGNTAWVSDPGVYKTTDGGESWQWIARYESDNNDDNVGMGWITQHGLFVKTLAIDPNNSARIYFGTSTHVFSTANAGVSWDPVYTKKKSNDYWQGTGLDTSVVADVTVDPTNPDNIYAGYWDLGFLKSTDGGVSFKRTAVGMEYKHNTFAIIVDPDNPSTLYAATGWWETNQGNVVKSTDAGETWTVIKTGLPDAQVWSIALDKNSPVNARILYATSYDHGIYKTTNGGESWFQINTGLGDNGNLQVRKVVIDPNDSTTLYAGTEVKQIENADGSIQTIEGGLYQSTNGGTSWQRIGVQQVSVWGIAIDPNNSQVVYTATYSGYDHSKQQDFIGGVYKSSDKGLSWQRINTGFGSEDNLNVSSVAVSPDNSNRLYASTSDDPYHDRSSGRGIFKSDNAGQSWEAISASSKILDFATVKVDPTNASIIYGGSAGNGILRGFVGGSP